MIERTYTWRPAPYDAVNNYKLELGASEVPKVKYLVNSPVEYQIKGDCVFNAITTHLEHLLWKRTGERSPQLSRMFAYYQYRERFGEVTQDNGASIFYAVKILLETGVCREEVWPYTEADFATKPSAEAYANAKNYKFSSYVQLITPTDLISCLASDYGCVGGISVYSSMESKEVDETGIVPMPVKGDEFKGGHCIYFCGYDLHKQKMQFQNSWGLDWAYKTNYPGHGWIGFDYLSDKFLSGEFFTLR